MWRDNISQGSKIKKSLFNLWLEHHYTSSTSAYLRSVEKMCRGDFTFFSDIFLLCVLVDFSLPFFHCCVTNVCMILQFQMQRQIFHVGTQTCRTGALCPKPKPKEAIEHPPATVTTHRIHWPNHKTRVKIGHSHKNSGAQFSFCSSTGLGGKLFGMFRWNPLVGP